MVYSADIIPGAEALSAQKRLTALLSYKLKWEYSEMCGFVRVRMSLAIVRSNSLLLHGPCEKGACIWQQPELTDGGGDGTSRALAWVNLGETERMGGRRRGQGLGHGAESSERISRESSESEYSWDWEGIGNT